MLIAVSTGRKGVQLELCCIGVMLIVPCVTYVVQVNVY